MRTVTVKDYNVDSYNLGRVGEHNATQMVITPPDKLLADSRAHYFRIIFRLRNISEPVISDVYDSYPFTIVIPKNLTKNSSLSIQCVAYENRDDDVNNFIGIGKKIEGFKFEPSDYNDSLKVVDKTLDDAILGLQKQLDAKALKETKINGHTLYTDVTLTASDVGAIDVSLVKTTPTEDNKILTEADISSVEYVYINNAAGSFIPAYSKQDLLTLVKAGRRIGFRTSSGILIPLLYVGQNDNYDALEFCYASGNIDPDESTTSGLVNDESRIVYYLVKDDAILLKSGNLYVHENRTINSKSLSADITINISDIPNLEEALEEAGKDPFIVVGTRGEEIEIEGLSSVLGYEVTFDKSQSEIDDAIEEGRQIFLKMDDSILMTSFLPTLYTWHGSMLTQIDDEWQLRNMTCTVGENKQGAFYFTIIKIEDIEQITTNKNNITILQTEVNNLKSRGRFLSLWNCSTGLPTTNPTISPYEYKTGDYYIVSTISDTTNYKPDGPTYTSGVPSEVEETDNVSVDDAYYYDGSSWKLQQNTPRIISASRVTYNDTTVEAELTSHSEQIENKIDYPSGGSVGNVLKKTATGSEWGTVEGSGGTKSTIVQSWEDLPTTGMKVGDIATNPNDTSEDAIPISSVTGLQSALDAKGTKVTSISSSSTDDQYPSAKCVYDLIGVVDTLLGTGEVGT